MANPEDSFKDNAPGAWYVDAQCIACGQCGNDVPSIFAEAADYGHFRVHRQPLTPGELHEAEDARERCPVEAIGNDRTA